MYAMGTATTTRVWLESALLPEGWAREVRIEAQAGRITALSRGVPAAAGDERCRLGLPGLPNLHSHAFQRGFAGLSEHRGSGTDSFWSWRELMYRFVAGMGPEEFEAISALAFIEMLEAGFTHVGEFHYLHHDRDGTPFANRAELAERVVAAAARSGIGLTLLPVFYAHGGFGGQPPAARQRRFINDPESYLRIVSACHAAVRTLAGAQVGMAPHSLRAVTPEELSEIVRSQPGALIHIHIAEQLREVDECLAWSGQRPIQWLLDHQRVDALWCLVHATHAHSEELTAMRECGAVVGLCPITEASLGDGIFPAAAFLAPGGRIGIGSDSNIRIDAAEELRMLEYSQRLVARARNVLARGPDASTGRSLFEAAHAGGRQVLASGAGLAVGEPLDLVTLDTEHPALLERQEDEVLDSWVFAAGREAIDGVWRAGTKVVSGGRHQARAQVAQAYARALRTLRAAAG
jgi:formimidoylglutamate deiminase